MTSDVIISCCSVMNTQMALCAILCHLQQRTVKMSFVLLVLLWGHSLLSGQTTLGTSQYRSFRSVFKSNEPLLFSTCCSLWKTGFSVHSEISHTTANLNDLSDLHSLHFTSTSAILSYSFPKYTYLFIHQVYYIHLSCHGLVSWGEVPFDLRQSKTD